MFPFHLWFSVCVCNCFLFFYLINLFLSFAPIRWIFVHAREKKSYNSYRQCTRACVGKNACRRRYCTGKERDAVFKLANSTLARRTVQKKKKMEFQCQFTLIDSSCLVSSPVAWHPRAVAQSTNAERWVLYWCNWIVCVQDSRRQRARVVHCLQSVFFGAICCCLHKSSCLITMFCCCCCHNRCVCRLFGNELISVIFFFTFTFIASFFEVVACKNCVCIVYG